MRKWLHKLIWVLLLIPFCGWGQTNPDKACRVEEGRLIFTLDSRWNAKQRDQVVKMFDLDSALVSKVLKGEPPPVAKGVTWSVKKLDASLVELSKPLQSAAGFNPGTQDVTMLDDRWMGPKGVIERESEPYGMNLFTRFDAFSYRNGAARFFLPGNLKAREVYLSGSFNDWSTLLAPMQRTDSGWIASVRLKPGKYQYKYIIDGRWSPDPHNRQGEDDTYGDHNSVVFCYNQIFYLRGYQGARGVVVAGSFNGWNDTELRMQRVPGGWIRGMYLREGTHAYKFLVDKTWVLDPENKGVRPDGTGNKNNFVSIGDTFYFRLAGYPDAKQIIVTGTFNAWNENELTMEKVNGGWELLYVLRAGNYEYKFIRDGRWMTDPANPYTTGSGEFKNSFLVIRPNHLFVLEGYPDAKEVVVTGSFNGWPSGDYRMVRHDGKWKFPIWLRPGKHIYKFVVDRKWILDPANTLWEKNEYGTGNSVLWMEP
jgi:hypothetical protein